jgi:hypothetical protein
MSGHGLLERMLGDQLIVNGMLIVIAVSTLTFAYRHLRHVRGQRGSAHSRARRAPDTGGDPWMSPPPRAAAGRPAPAGAPRVAGAAAPSWPGRPGPGALHPDHPSWPGRPDPRWAAAEAALRADDYPSWPGGQPAPVPAPVPAPAWDAGSVEVAAWILAEANAQATEIRHEARDEAAASLADAKKEAADLLRQASDRAAAKLAAVESEAAQVQAALMKLSTELSEVAANALHPAAD